MIKIQIKALDGSILFEYEKEDNTLKKTIEEAVRRGADLGGADLRGADLRGAYLGGAYLGKWGKINSSTDMLFVSHIGSRNDITMMFKTDKGIFVRCGCFKGTLDEFVNKVKETHKGNIHERNYLALVEFAKIKFEYKREN